MYIKTILATSMLAACATLPTFEKPPCDEATAASIVATCDSEEDCNRKLDERQATCAKRISEEK